MEAVRPGGAFDLGPMREVLADPLTWRATWRSIDAAVLSTVLALVLGGAMAILVAATDLPRATPLVFAFMLPLMIPPQITALSWAQLMGPSSPLLLALGLAPPPGSPNPIYSREGIILLLGIQHSPLVFITMRAAIRRLPMSLLEAAALAGATPLQQLRLVVLPLLTPAMIAGSALAFVSAIGNFGIAALIGIPASHTLLPVLIYRKLASFGPTALSDVAVLSVIVAAIAFLGVMVQAVMLRRRDLALEATNEPPVGFALGRLAPLLEALAWLVIAFVLIAPLMALLASALTPAYGVPLTLETVSLSNFAEVTLRQDATRRAFMNSTILAGSAALILMALALPLAYFITWRTSRLTRFLNGLAELPYALPGVVLAVACIMLFLRPLPLFGVSIYGTLWIILVAYLARFLTLNLRPLVAGFSQLDRAVDEAAQLDGAGILERLRFVLMPILAPLAVAGGILVFLTAFNELTVSALLWSAGTETLGVVVFNLDDGGYTALASAVAVLCVAAIMALMLTADVIDRSFKLGVLPWTH